jgi:hypothetical protein
MSTMNLSPMQSFQGQGMPMQYPYGQYEYNGMLLLQQLKAQIEFYFCPQNLAKDGFLQSQLNATNHLGAVPIEIICNFPKVRHLHALVRTGGHIPAAMAPPADPQVLRVALEGSTVVNVSDDGMWISPIHFFPLSADFEDPKDTTATVATSTTVASTPSSPSSQATGSSSLGVPTHPLPLKERTTVIVRDIPETATPDQVLEAFSSSDITPKSAHPDVGNTWYVTFETEDQAVAALSVTSNRTIAGAPIQGRLKSEQLRPPAMALPPQDLRNAPPVPNLQPAQQYHMAPPAQVMQQPAYGYVAYPYAVPQHQHHQQQAFRMQQQYFQQQQQYAAYPQAYPQYVQRRPPQQQQRYATPPPHVYVRPTKQSQQQNRKLQKRGKNNNRNQQNKLRNNNNGGDQAVQGPTEQRPHQHKNQNNQEKNQAKEQPKRNNVKNKDDIALSAEHFPALGNVKPKTNPQCAAATGGYAQALLKQLKTAPTFAELPSLLPEHSEQELDAAMSSLAFSAAASASYDEW